MSYSFQIQKILVEHQNINQWLYHHGQDKAVSKDDCTDNLLTKFMTRLIIVCFQQDNTFISASATLIKYHYQSTLILQ